MPSQNAAICRTWGYRYKVVERYTTVKLHERGKTVKWENPLISDVTMAKDLAEWIADYYSAGIPVQSSGHPTLQPVFTKRLV